MKETDKIRIVQELVPGREITLAHMIAGPDDSLYKKISGKNCESEGSGPGAIGIMTVSPAETAIIMADIAIKASGVGIRDLSHANGSLIMEGSVSAVEEALEAVVFYVRDVLGYSVCEITKT